MRHTIDIETRKPLSTDPEPVDNETILLIADGVVQATIATAQRLAIELARLKGIL